MLKVVYLDDSKFGDLINYITLYKNNHGQVDEGEAIRELLLKGFLNNSPVNTTSINMDKIKEELKNQLQSDLKNELQSDLKNQLLKELTMELNSKALDTFINKINSIPLDLNKQYNRVSQDEFNNGLEQTQVTVNENNDSIKSLQQSEKIEIKSSKINTNSLLKNLISNANK